MIKVKFLTILIFLFLFFFGTAKGVEAATYFVSTSGNNNNPGTKPQPWRTIQKAANTLSSGDFALVSPGTYDEHVTISRSGITLEAESKVLMKGFHVSGNSNTIKGFEISEVPDNAGVMVTGNHNLIENNEIYHTNQDGIWFFGSYNTFRKNYIHDILKPSIGGDPHADCFQTWGWNWDTTNVLFEKNICDHNRTSGSNQILMLERQSGAEIRDIVFRNNIFIMHDPGYSPMNFQRKSGQGEIFNMVVLNNHFIHRNGNGQYGVGFINISGGILKNNLFYNYGDTGNSYVRIDGDPSSIDISNNLIYKTDGIAPAKGPYPGDVWMQDPRFVDLNNFNFHLRADSPAIDTGVNIDIIDDLDGNIRPQGSGYDIGAYEYGGSIASPTTTPPPDGTPGDGNNDGAVDGQDFIIWLTHFGQNVSGANNGDYNDNGRVEIGDYVVWINTYNTEPPPPTPDPTSRPTSTSTPYPTGSTLQFKSGFEDNTRIGGSGGMTGRLIYNIDSSVPTGINDWDKLRSGKYLPWVVQANGYFQGGAMKIAQDPTNPDNKVLHLHNTELDADEGRLSRSQWTMMQAQWWVDDNTPNRFDKQFYRYRMYIPDDIRTIYSYGDRSSWYMIWESHSWQHEAVGEKTRYGVYIKKDTNSDQWYFQVIQQRPEGCSDPGKGPCEAYWENTNNQGIAVSFGEWFTFEVFFKYHETDGEFFVAVTREGQPRQVTAHYKGQTKFDQKLHDQMVFKMYHHRDYLDKLGETSQYYDDFEIWSDYPPGY